MRPGDKATNVWDAITERRIKNIERSINRIPSLFYQGGADTIQAWVFDGNTVFTGVSNIYGCRKYIGTNIAAEAPALLPTYGTSETEGDYTSGIDGVCRLYLGTDDLGHKQFVLGYSPSIPYWLITNQTVQLGTPVYTTTGKIYPIVWGFTT